MRPCLCKGPTRLLLLGAAVACSAGCTYVRDRYRDALDMLDIGLTVSKKPEFAAFKACTGLTCIGYGDIDGYFVGLGGGKVGMARYASKSVGYGLWGNYQNVLMDSDDARDGTHAAPDAEQTGLLAAVEGQSNDVACVQQLHIGWTGIVFNIKWAEILDFFLGWTTIDICRDDGVERQGWFASKSVEVVQKPDATSADTQPPAAETQIASAPTAKATPADAPANVPDVASAAKAPDTEHLLVAPDAVLADASAALPEKVEEVVSVTIAPGDGSAAKAPTSDTVSVLASARAALAFADQVAFQRVGEAQDAPPEPEKSAVHLRRIATPSGSFYVVQSGDVGLMQIARTQLGDAAGWRKIAELNGLEPPYIIRVGDVLRLPD